MHESYSVEPGIHALTNLDYAYGEYKDCQIKCIAIICTIGIDFLTC